MGKELIPARAGRDRGGATVTAHRRQSGDGTVRRLRRQALPHAVIGGLAAGGTVSGALADAAGSPGVLGIAVAGVGALGATGWVRRRGGGLRDLAVALGGACWCGWTVASGMSWDALAVLAVGGYAAALPYWRRHRLPDPPEITAPAPVPQPDEMSPPRLWERHIACSGGPLPGTHLTGEEQLRTGLRYTLHLVPGRQSLSDVRTATAKLRSGLRLRPGHDLVIEQHPEADEATVQLTIVQRSPVLTTAQPWPGGTYDPQAGTVQLGPYIDGEGVAVWLLHRDHRLWSGFLTGATGSGKSRLMEAIALGAAAAGCVAWFADPQAGASSPFLADHADWTARDVDQAREMLEAARQVKELRQAQNAYEGWEGWHPDQGRPGLVVVIDECHRVFEDARCQALATEIAREGGKCGVAIVAASQVATLDVWGAGAGADALRSSVTAGNVVLLRTKSNNTKSVLSAGGVDPTTFPRVPGYAYLLDDTGTRRSAPLRGYYLDDQTRDRAAREVSWPELDPASAAAAGPTYQRRRELAATARQALAAKIATLTGQLPAASTLPGKLAPAPAIPVPRFPAPPEIRPAVAGTAVLDRPTAPPVAAPTAVEAVARLLAAGVTAPGEMQARSGYSETAVRQALRELAAQGRARRVRHGVWALKSAEDLARRTGTP